MCGLTAAERVNRLVKNLRNALLDSGDVIPSPPSWCFVPIQSDSEQEYLGFPQLSDLCLLFAEGVKTGRDWLVLDFEGAPILNRMEEIRNSKETDDDLCERIGLSRKKAWNFKKARSALEGADLGAALLKRRVPALLIRTLIRIA